MVQIENDNRYLISNFKAASLENNPLNSPVERDLNIYLPPNYYDNDERFPVLYFLHGYGGNNRTWTVTYEDSKDKAIPWEMIPRKIKKELDMGKMLTFEKFDELILRGELKPFMFVQPDASLHVNSLGDRKDLRGLNSTKGSFYVNSPHSGNYLDYIVKDVISYVDTNFRTISKKESRALLGGSMGGYGALYVGFHHPELFNTVVSLSPGSIGGETDFINWELRIPIFERIVGKKMADEFGDAVWQDIIDTLDLVFSNDNRLIPTVKFNDKKEIVEMNEEAYKNWQKYDLNAIISQTYENFKDVNLLINCEENDEFGLAVGAKRLHDLLEDLKIPHEFEIYSDPAAALTPHILGIGYHVLPGINFCLENLKH